MTNDMMSARTEHATGERVTQLIRAWRPLAIGYTKAEGLVAALSMALLVQDPELTGEELHTGVKGASEWIAMYLSAIHQTLEKKDIN